MSDFAGWVITDMAHANFAICFVSKIIIASFHISRALSSYFHVFRFFTGWDKPDRAKLIYFL